MDIIMIKIIKILTTLFFFIFLNNAYAADECGIPKPLVEGSSPNKLIVIIPATTQGKKDWKSFKEKMVSESEGEQFAWMVYEHGIEFTSTGDAKNIALDIASCIGEKVDVNNYQEILLVGHSVGGMLARYAYLHDAGAFLSDAPVADRWSSRVNKILLFASVNRGIRPDAKWWSSPVNWLLRALPHPKLILEDLAVGSDFIADIRIAWIRYFGELNNEGSTKVAPRVVQYWGRGDSIITEDDNADIQAFSGPVVVRVSGADHGDLQRLEPEYVDDIRARWEIYRKEIFDTRTQQVISTYSPRRVLMIVRGIRDSSNADWVQNLSEKAEDFYGKDNVIEIEYGYFSAAHFSIKPIRGKNIPVFRDIYAQELAKNPLTKFDFIGHSNGTYILGHSLLTTQSMKFNNVVLAAPVLSTSFDWESLFKFKQVKSVRYDTSRWDWPVGILCQALRAIGFDDVGPSGLVSFGEGRMNDGRVKQVGLYDGSHGAALQFDPDNGVDNLQHLLQFAITGNHFLSDIETSPDIGLMQQVSRATIYVVWILVFLCLIFILRYFRNGGRVSLKSGMYFMSALFLVYGVLDII